MRVAVVEVLISAIANPTLPALPCASVPSCRLRRDLSLTRPPAPLARPRLSHPRRPRRTPPRPPLSVRAPSDCLLSEGASAVRGGLGEVDWRGWAVGWRGVGRVGMEAE